MAKIIAPNKDYNEVSATVSFVGGVGETSDPWLISWFKSNGYEVQEDEQQADEEAESQEDEQQADEEAESQEDEQQADEEAESQEDDAEFPKHVGVGNYELSDGSKVKGKDKAVEAEAQLKEGE